MKSEEKVVSMEDYRKQAEGKDITSLEQLNIKTSHDISRMALVTALLAVLLAGVLFFKANQNIGSIAANMTSLDKKVGTMDMRMAELENLPAKSKKMVLNTIIMEMAQKASYLSTQIDNQDQAAKLLQAMELLQQARPE